MQTHIFSALNEARTTLDAFVNDRTITLIGQAVDTISTAFNKGNKIISCGNGGSMCDAMHFAEELSGRYRKDRRALPAIAISDPAHISCVANDYGYEFIFSRFVEAFGIEGDVLLAISTSGNSPNVLRASEAAKARNMKVIALLGRDGGKLATIADLPIIVPGETTDRMQELHIKTIHIMIECIERTMFPELY